MKPIILFQNGETISTPWVDAINGWNEDVDILGWHFASKNPRAELRHFDKKTMNMLFTQKEQQFYITKPYIDPNTQLSKILSRVIDIQYIIDYMSESNKETLGFGCFLDNKPKNQIDILNDSVYFTRDKEPGGHIYNTKTGEYLSTDENKSINGVIYFLVYKLKKNPVYIFIFNPQVVDFTNDFDFETEHYITRRLTAHEHSFSNQFLKPKMSKNAFPLENKWYVVKGDEFTFEPGALGILYMHYDFVLDGLTIKSDLNIEKIGDNKYKAKFKKGQYHAYLSFRLNTASWMDWTFLNSGNRLVYNIHINRHYEEE